MGYQKIAQRNPKTGVQKKSKNFYGEKVICKSRFLGQWGYPWEFFQNLHRHTPWQAEHSGWRNPAVHGCLRGQNPLEKLVFDFYSLKKNFKYANGVSKDSPRKPKDRCAKKIKNFLWGKSYTQIKVFGSLRVPLGIFSKFAQTYSLTSRAFWLKKPCCARMSKGSKPPRKISFRLLLPQKNFKKPNGVSKDSPTKPKDRCAKKNSKFSMGKKLYANQGFGSMRVPLGILSKFAQTYSLTSRAFWLKKPCCARMSKGSKPPRKISFRLLLPQKKFEIGKWGIKR